MQTMQTTDRASTGVGATPPPAHDAVLQQALAAWTRDGSIPPDIWQALMAQMATLPDEELEALFQVLAVPPAAAIGRYRYLGLFTRNRA